MVEVIDLLSSSPPRLPLNPPCNDRSRLSSPNNFSDFSFGDTGTADVFDFAVQPPSKRRKVKVREDAEDPKCLPKASNSIFDLSSDLGLGPDSPQISSNTNKNHIDGPRELDDFVLRFSSSAPESSRRMSTKEPVVLELSSDDDSVQNDPIETSSQPENQTRAVFSERTTNLLATMRQSSRNQKPGIFKNVGISKASKITSLPESSKSNRFKKSRKVDSNDGIDSSQQERPPKHESAPSQQLISGKQSKPGVKSAKLADSVDKVAEKERKKIEKEKRQLEKQQAAEIAEVNKVKTNKKTSAPEMIVDMPDSLRQASVGKQVEEFLKVLDVQCSYYNDDERDAMISSGSSCGKIIKWRRKVTAEYDNDNEIWRPLPQARVSTEEHLIIYCKAEELLACSVNGWSDQVNSTDQTSSEEFMKSNLDALVKHLRQQYPGCRPIFLIEGLTSWVRRSQNAKNRAYTAAVRSQAQEGEEGDVPSSTQPANSRRKKKSHPRDNLDLSSITEEITESLLLHLQLRHQPLLIQHTTSPATSAAQINTFTQHLSTRPYRLASLQQNLSSASFCMTAGQIRTGVDAKETWIQMLQEINRVTPSMAYGIIGAGYSNPTDLVHGFRKEGRLMLEDVKKSTNKDGGWSDRRLGPMVSKRIYKVFMGKDPGARDGIA